jgi:hypothetical protein
LFRAAVVKMSAACIEDLELDRVASMVRSNEAVAA